MGGEVRRGDNVRINHYDPLGIDCDPSDPGTTRNAVNGIIRLNTQIANFWSNAHGWAPVEAADLLSKARLDWQVSMSHLLKRHIRKPKPEEAEAHLINARANLGAMVENTMKWFLSVYETEYAKNYRSVRTIRGAKCPADTMLQGLKDFFFAHYWLITERQKWFDFVDMVQHKRNAIHAYKTRDIDTLNDFRTAMKLYQ